MGIYSNLIFPRLLDLSMSSNNLMDLRRDLLATVEGDVLEIGFGTGLNLSCYPETVQKITAIDPNPGMNRLAKKRSTKARVSVEIKQLNGENLPFAAQTFDSVVSTWTLCSIPLVEQALAEVYRVLKPEGRFFFIEHGLSPEKSVQVWQNRLNPLQNRLADGCNLNRDMEQLITQANFSLVQLEKFYGEEIPKTLGYFYKGIATPL